VVFLLNHKVLQLVHGFFMDKLGFWVYNKQAFEMAKNKPQQGKLI